MFNAENIELTTIRRSRSLHDADVMSLRTPLKSATFERGSVGHPLDDVDVLNGSVEIQRGLPLQEPRQPRRGLLPRIRAIMNLQAVNSTKPRVIAMGSARWSGKGFPPNDINNRRYSILTFVPLSLANQFRTFFNVFFLFIAMSQFIPALQVGFLFVYFSPLTFVVCLSLIKDMVDDLQRYRRDCVANGEKFEKLTKNGDTVTVRAADIIVGDLLVLHQSQRIPADCILLKTSEKSGASFVRTDQLDGETDWKLRYPVKITHSMTPGEIATLRANIRSEPLHKDIYSFVGAMDVESAPSEGLTLENTLWANCVVASGTVICVVIHTGIDTRIAMNSSRPNTKQGLIERELNFIGVLCFTILLVLAFLLVLHQSFQGRWYVMFVRFVILLSAIIPISMRVNLDVARMWYSYDMGRDKAIPGTVARNTNIPEDLGRLRYLFSDKTGTLTKNKMEFRSLQLSPQLVLGHTDIGRFHAAIQEQLLDGGSEKTQSEPPGGSSSGSKSPVGVSAPTVEPLLRRRSPRTGGGGTGVGGFALGSYTAGVSEGKLIADAILAIALCHNVTPITDGGDTVEFQASSPDEVALVKFCSTIGVQLENRDINSMTLRIASGEVMTYDIVKIFPFSSERKSMSIILKQRGGPSGHPQGDYLFLMKGADSKMKTVVGENDWLDESCQEMAQAGLRTLVFAQRRLTEAFVENFLAALQAAHATLGEARGERIERAMRSVETGMQLVGVTGVEDELQDDVALTLETLGMCGIKVWILTGDKVETAMCIGRSTQLIPRSAQVEYMLCRTDVEVAHRLRQLNYQYNPAVVGDYQSTQWTLILDGTCLSICLIPALEKDFADVARTAYSVVVARCSPTQKADVVHAIRRHSPVSVRTAAIGDGGNDVAMILAANVGIGVEGVEGKQASMAADYSITKFSHCLRLIMWHGRNSYRRTCRLSQFIMHRGIIYSVVQAVFSTLFAGTTMSVFNGYLLMGYSTVFTMAPVFALVLDEDVSETHINDFPQLYFELLKSRSMNTRSFLQWVWISFFQGGIMMFLSLQLFSDEMFQIMAIAYTSLLLTELVIVAATAHLANLWRQRRSHFWLFIYAECFSILAFLLAVVVLPDTIDNNFFFSWSCWWRVILICSASLLPIFVINFIGAYIIFNQKSTYRM